jgi:hypothetical protein
MKIKKTTSLAVTGALLASGLSATLYAQAQTDKATPPKMGMMHDKMSAHHDKMMADMKAADEKLDALVAKMNGAKGNAKVDAMAAVVNELVAQRKMMRGQMMQCPMMGQGMKGGGMMGKPDAKPDAKPAPDEHAQHH